MASVLKLPNVFVIENNQFAYSTPLRMQSNSATFSRKAVGYGIPASPSTAPTCSRCTTPSRRPWLVPGRGRGPRSSRA